MSYYGMGRCAPCMGMGVGSVGAPGLGAIVMEPLKGGFGDAATLSMTVGGAAPAAMMIGGGIVYGAVSGVAAKSWKAAGNGALMGAGLMGLTGGLGMMAAGSAVSSAPAPTAGAEGLGGLTGMGVGYAVLGGAMLAYGAWRGWKGR